MKRKKVVFEVEAGDLFLYEISEQEKKELESFLQQTPLEFYLLRELLALRERIDREFAPQWTHRYEFNLDSAKTNFLIDQWDSPFPKYLYIHSCSGVVNLKFDSQNNENWLLSAKDLFEMVFSQIYLTWTAQATKKLIFYVSNRRILRSTLS